MYLYVYDSFLNNKKYGNLLAKIETRLTDLGIGGKIFRLSPLRNTIELLKDEVSNGVKTIVVVGDDKTLAQIINVVAKLDVTLGVIPIGPENKIAQILGINSPDEACNILSARKIEKVDLGKANDTYFISNITVDKGDVQIECENKYVVTSQNEDAISIFNLRPVFAAGWKQPNIFNPKDGKLEILIQPIKTGMWRIKKSVLENKSIIPFKKTIIKSKGSLSVFTDGQKVLKTPVKVEIIPNKLSIVVGKDRLF